jgi:hypothetical protein
VIKPVHQQVLLETTEEQKLRLQLTRRPPTRIEVMKRATNSTKAEIREAAAGIDRELSELERTQGENVDMRPCVSNDHRVSLQHRALVQRRLRLNEEIKKPVLTMVCSKRA